MYVNALAVDLQLGEYYAARMGRQSPGIQGRVGCNQEELIPSDPIDLIPRPTKSRDTSAVGV